MAEAESFELAHSDVRNAVFGRDTVLRDGELVIERDALIAHLRPLEGLGRLAVHIARPGDATRLVCVKDVVEPRSAERVANALCENRIRALRGVAVATCGQIVGAQEGIVDMRGPAAAHTPFSGLFLVVLDADPVPRLDAHRHERVLREAGLRAAAWLADQTVTAAVDEIERFSLAPVDPALPRVVYVYLLLSQGLLHDTWVEGENARNGLPRGVHPKVAFSGGIVSGNCVSACDKNTTWHHQNNPILRALLSAHGRDLCFAGCVLSNEPVRLADKESSARRCVESVIALGAEGVVISKEGFGNPDADLMMLIRGLERAGVRCVALTDEFAGVDGESPSLADGTPEADALISLGNANERITLPPMERTIGPIASLPRLAGASATSVAPDGAIEVELQSIVGATNPLGAMRLSCREI